MRFLMLIFYVCLILLGVSFAALNAGNLTLNLYFRTLTMPVSVLMIATFSIGVLIGFVIFLGRYWCKSIKYRKVKHQFQLMEREIKNLREIPLKD
ncbi:MAG: LapA family protein [Gammaproteobacteria bacterium]|nr:LapA family protein [Gammaproteobacteria bacterium]